MNTVIGPFEREPQFHADGRTKESLHNLITVIGQYGVPSTANDGFLGYWNSVIGWHKGKWRSERSVQHAEKDVIDMYFSTPERHIRGLIISGKFSVLGEVVSFPRASHIPRVYARVRADLLDGPNEDSTLNPIVWVDYEISTAPAKSKQAGGVGISADISIDRRFTNDPFERNAPFMIPDSIMEVWDEMHLGQSNLPGYPEVGPLENKYFDGHAEHLQALTRLALGQWPK